MKERPIIFSGPMVRAMLDGRKTQTRRIVKWKPRRSEHGRRFHNLGVALGHYNAANTSSGWVLRERLAGIRNDLTMPAFCPYGVPGDRLWVREKWRATGTGQLLDDDGVLRDRPNSREQCVYAADEVADAGPWRPSILMPRLASRITLEVKNVRVERVQDISEGDAIAEGAERNVDAGHEGEWQPDWGYRTLCAHYPSGCECFPNATARDWYRELWNTINGDGSWAADPWVWVIEFERLKP